MRIHREGYATIEIVLIFLILINGLAYYFNPIWIINILFSFLSFLFFYLLLHFFRTPERAIAINDKHILALCKAEETIISMFGISSHMELEIASDFPRIIDLILV